MSTSAFDVVGVGNAIVDVSSFADDAFLAARDLAKGSMTIVDEARADELYAAMGTTVVSSGGSAGNTIAGLASLGARAAYIGRVRDDALGAAFRHDMTAIGATFTTPPATQGASTARCLILVTPDAERTMATYLGACVDLEPEDIDPAIVAAAQITYLEGYLYDPPGAQAAFHRAAGLAHAAGRRVALSLSDPFCVERHREEFLALVDRHVDVLFGNEAELLRLFETAHLDGAIERLRSLTDCAAITLGARGSVVVTREAVLEAPAARVGRVVDTNGAGDLYAAGFLYGLTHGEPLRACAELAGRAAAEVIAHVGARPQTSLKTLLTAPA